MGYSGGSVVARSQLGCGMLYRVESRSTMVLDDCRGLFAFFAFVQASAWWRGLEISCGCFSIDSGGPVVNPWTFGSVAALSCVALSVVKLQHALNRSGYAI